MLKSLSKLEFLCTLTVHGIDKLSIFEQALLPSRPIIATAELNGSLDRLFLNVDAGRPHLPQLYPRWRLIYDTRDVLRFRLSLNQSMKVDRFSILPPEIRTRIYEHYFQSWTGPIQQPVTCFECYERFPVFYPNYRYYLLAPLAKAEAQCADYKLELMPAIFDTSIDHPLYRVSLDKLHFERGPERIDNGFIEGMSSLLRVSRLTNLEAAPMIYGAVQFDTTSLSAVFTIRPNAPNPSVPNNFGYKFPAVNRACQQTKHSPSILTDEGAIAEAKNH